MGVHIGKIFGIGLSKTGTTSLAAALNRLGIPTKDMPCEPKTLIELRSGTYQLSILEKYRAVTDIPVAPYYAELDHCYPNSKFILTVRDVESWLRSLEADWKFSEGWRKTNRDFRAFFEFIFAVVYGTLEFNRERCARVYQRHCEQIRAYFKNRPDDLLILNVCSGQGYERLCPFLGLPVLSESFPVRNTSEDKQRASAYIKKVDQATEDVAGLCGNGHVFVMADGGELAGTELEYTLTPASAFAYRYSHPSSAEEVLSALDDARRAGANRFALTFPCFWWFHAYPDLPQKLRNRFGCALETDDIIVFEI
jgi:hypothetical protein